MPGTARGLRTDPTSRLAELGRQRPEWQIWLRLLAEVEGAVEEACRSTRVVGPRPPELSPGAPLLHGSLVEISAVELERLLDRLLGIAADLEKATSLRKYHPRAGQAAELIGAALRQDRDSITSVAGERELDAEALSSVVHLAAVPILRSCGRTLQHQVLRHWPHGFCPICAAWPTLAERRGLDRTRRLRCGRCGGEWEIEWLTCAYCGEREHQQLGSLLPDDAGELLQVEICANCRGYLKSVATLQAIPAHDLLLQDLETVELDLVALERGYRRPEESGFPIWAEVR